MRYLVALAGNQNSGKTTLFNRLTGSNQHVGNFPGVTVEKKEGIIRQYRKALLVDLPGIYSLSPYSAEEVVSRDFLLFELPDLIVNIVDATNIERNLYLSLQLMELGIPMVIALNMMDEVRSSGNSIDVNALSAELGFPVVPISASKGHGIGDLIETIEALLEAEPLYPKPRFFTGAVENTMQSISQIAEEAARNAGYPLEFAATKLIEGDQPTRRALSLTEEQMRLVEHLVSNMERSLKTDREAALADMRYSYIEELCARCVTRHRATNEQVRSEKIDRILTHRFLGLPIFLGVMLLIFTLTFHVLGVPLQGLMEEGIAWLTEGFAHWMTVHQVSPWLQSLLLDGVCAGVGGVLSFLPLIVLLFFFLSLLEDSGYMARVVFIMDKIMRKIGLSGSSVVPMLTGFGCSVPAIMATRTLPSSRDRKVTILITPFMSCSAKLPIYAMIVSAFFPHRGALVMLSIYCIGILTAILTGRLLQKTRYQGSPAPFVMELPSYRIPTAKNVLLNMREKAGDFLHKAFTVIFLASIVIWFLQSFDLSLHMVANSGDSILALIGSAIAPLFSPLGFQDWRISTSLITGVMAKESVVSTFAVLTGSGSTASLNAALQSLFTPLSAYSFLVFTALYFPCVAAFAASKRELGSLVSALKVATYQTGIAYVVAFVAFQIGRLFL